MQKKTLAKRVHFRIRRDLLEKLDKIARRNYRTRSNQLERLLEMAQ